MSVAVHGCERSKLDPLCATLLAMLAAADESYVQRGRGVYAVAAVVLPPSRARQVRKVAKELRLPGQQRLHRRDERQERQRSITERIGQLDLKAYAVVNAPVSRRKQERARQKCLHHLIVALFDEGVRELLLESRASRNDRHDRQTIVAAQHKGVISERLVYRFPRAADEPLLWLADFVVGAVAADHASGDQEESSTLRAILTVLPVP